MNTNILLTSVITLCSIGGWYVVLNKYFQLRKILKDNDKYSETIINKISRDDSGADIDYVPGRHIPGMGPAPLLGDIHDFGDDDYVAQPVPVQQNSNKPRVQVTHRKRHICNWATIMHLSGFALISGLLFINVLVPSIIWLLKKDQHPYLAKHGREIINFQILLSLLYLCSSAVGVALVWLVPETVNSIFAATKTIRMVFSSGMNTPFNLFTFVPFVLGCLFMIRGAIAAYRGSAFSYPCAIQFIPVKKRTTAMPSAEPVAPQVATKPPVRVNFG